VTFWIWRRYSDQSWQIGPIDFPVGHPDPDGSELAAVEHVYQHRPLTPVIVGQLNPDLSPADLIADVKEIGYPE